MEDAPAARPAGLERSLLQNLISAILPQLGSFVVSILLFPHLGPEGTGVYLYTMSTATILLIVAKFGVHAAASRMVAENEDEPGPWIRASLWIRSAFTLPTCLLVAATAPLLATALGHPELRDAYLWLPAIILSASYYELGNEILVGLRQFSGLLAARSLFLSLRLAAVIWVRASGLGAAAFLGGHAAAQLLAATALWGWLLRRFGDSPDPARRAEARGRIREISLPLALSSASFLIYGHTDKIMLGWLKGMDAVGEFGTARTVLDAALFPTFALAWTLRPNLIRALKSGEPGLLRHRLAEGLRDSNRYSFGACALLYVFGPGLLRGFYGEAFTTAGELLRWMLPILFLRGMGTLIFPALLAADRQTRYAKLMAWTAALNVVANLALIPRFGANGAIAATVASLVLLTVGGFASLRSAFGPLPWKDGARGHLAALLLSALLVALGARLVPADSSLIRLLVGAAVATLAYLALTFWAGRSRPQ